MIANQDTSPLKSGTTAFIQERWQGAARLMLYLYVVLVGSPIRWFPIDSGVDATWLFALNQTAARGLQPGRDSIFSYGPLAYLTFPQIENLTGALWFQTALWIVLAAIFADLFFRAGFTLRNLAWFSVFFGVSAPLYWFNRGGVESLVVGGAIILLVVFAERGGFPRYLTALILLGVAPLLKLATCVVGGTALAGFLLYRTLERRTKAIPEIALGAVTPVGVTIAAGCAVCGGWGAFTLFVRASLEQVRSYSSGVALEGPQWELPLAVVAAAILGIFLWLRAGRCLGTWKMYLLLTAGPLLVAYKHGFGRQDVHTICYFCTVALLAAVAALAIPRDRLKAPVALVSAAFLIFASQTKTSARAEFGFVSGASAALKVWGVLHRPSLEQKLKRLSTEVSRQFGLEPEIRSLIGDSPMASLSIEYAPLAPTGLHVEIYPVIQRFQAFTPYLDGLNAAWIREKGPRFLLFDGWAIDGRNAWAETPSMWLEVYRWYDTRWLGSRNLLLERRSAPRSFRFEAVSRTRSGLPVEIKFPNEQDALYFWTTNCSQSVTGRLRELLFRAPSQYATIVDWSGSSRSQRVLPAVLPGPVAGNFLPTRLAGFAAAFQSCSVPRPTVRKIVLSEGFESYSKSCEVEILRAVPEESGGTVRLAEPGRR